jgi:hypothetical protein
VGNSTLTNCIVVNNSASSSVNYFTGDDTFDHCFTSPLPQAGIGNFDLDPLFINPTNDFHLGSNSPCINAGVNSAVTTPTDVDGDPRIQRGTVDAGAYEFKSPGSLISYAWLDMYGLPTDGSADYADPDGDGMNNWQEWRCGTNPTNASSALRLLNPSFDGTNITVNWASVAGVTYFLQRSADTAASWQFVSIATNLPGQSGITAFADTNAPLGGASVYRVGVGP